MTIAQRPLPGVGLFRLYSAKPLKYGIDFINAKTDFDEAIMTGLHFVRQNHLSVAEGCFLPRAELLGHIDNRLQVILYSFPELKPYIPELLNVDIFVSWDDSNFIILISKDKRAHFPTRGMETTYLPGIRQSGNFSLDEMDEPIDISDTKEALNSFRQAGFTPGFAAVGTFPHSIYTPEAEDKKEKTGTAVANLIGEWARRMKENMENSRIFLSHKGVNKPLVANIDKALRMLGLQTWFDRDDLAAGAPLVRGVNSAFDGCAAAVFFISKDFVDSGVIRNEINSALHSQAMRNDGFSVIPIVLSQHGGNDTHVPNAFSMLVWKHVDDVEIVPTILRSLPPSLQNLVKYTTLK